MCVIELFESANVFTQVNNFTNADVPLNGISTKITIHFKKYIDAHFKEITPSQRGLSSRDLPFVFAYNAVQKMYTRLRDEIEERCSSDIV